MATGIPVVGSTCGETPNVIGHKDLVFLEGNPQELAAILARLISEPSSDYSLKREINTTAMKNSPKID